MSVKKLLVLRHRVLPRVGGHSSGRGCSGADCVVDGSASTTQRRSPVGQGRSCYGIREAGHYEERERGEKSKNIK